VGCYVFERPVTTDNLELKRLWRKNDQRGAGKIFHFFFTTIAVKVFDFLTRYFRGVPTVNRHLAS